MVRCKPQAAAVAKPGPIRSCGLILLAATLLLFQPQGSALAAEAACRPADYACPVDVTVSPKWHAAGQAFEGWGTALAWFANVTGKLPDPIRIRLADLLYGDDGLQMNIARYNIGGGNAPDIKPYLRAGADVPGFWRKPAGVAGEDWWRAEDAAHWDWTADAGQRWWLDAIRERVPAKVLLFEAFSNSPPHFMTVSGRVSGHADGLTDNLRPGYENAFAEYLVRVTSELESRHGVKFRTLSPVNEPDTPYWFAANTQEGAHWAPARQALIIRAVKKALEKRRMGTEIAAVDETNAQTFVRDWAGLDTEAIAAIGQINVHTYDTTGKTGVRDIARATGKRLWMSEVDLSPPNVSQDYSDMRPAIALSEQITSDLNRLEPVAWVFWQAVENQSTPPEKGSNWGLIKMDFANSTAPTINITAKYWAMANYSRFVRPGDRLVPVDDTDTVVAMKPDRRSFVVVHTNPGLYARRVAITLPHGASMSDYMVSAVMTDSRHKAETVYTRRPLTDDGVVAPPMSITTFVFTPARQ
jgi:O-glycosyl hydrolase